MFNLILFGPPGSGKGTQSELIKNHFNLKHVSTGDLLRAEVSSQTPLGIEAQKFMDAGQLVPDQVVIGMISNLIEANKSLNGFIFDGFPRTEAQAAALDTMLQEKGSSISMLLSLVVEEEELKRRMLERAKISGRSDDNEAVIANRIVEYHNKTKPVFDYYEKQNKVVSVNGIGSIEDIFNAISKEISAVI